MGQEGRLAISVLSPASPASDLISRLPVVKHIYSAEAALTGTDSVGLIVRIIRANYKSQQMSRSGITVTVTAAAKRGNKIFTVGDGMDDLSSDSCGVMLYTGEKWREYEYYKRGL